MGSTCNTPKKQRSDQVPKINIINSDNPNVEKKEEESEVHPLPPKKHSKKKKTQKIEEEKGEEPVQSKVNTTESSKILTNGMTQKINILSKQNSQTTDPGSNNQQRRQTLNDDSIVVNQMKKMAVKLNPAKETLHHQRDFYWNQFSQQMEDKLSDKSILNDIIQMLKMFFSHIETTLIYWTKFWLLSNNASKGVVVAYQNNIGEIKKIRILFSKNIEAISSQLDNYYYFTQIAKESTDFIKIFEYNFRINKKYLNYYIFSEQEYFEHNLDQADYNLAIFLIKSLKLMHQNSYFHGGFQLNYNILLLELNCPIFMFILIKMVTQYSRRNLKYKELRLNELQDIENVAYLILNYYLLNFQQDIRSYAKKFQDFYEFCKTNQFIVEEFFRQYIILMSKTNQIYYDLRSEELYQLMIPQSSSQQIFNKRQAQNSCLWHLEENVVIFYCLTSQRTSKSITKYRIPKTTFASSSNKLYLIIENTLCSMEFKMLTDFIEDTIEILLMAFKQVLAQLEKSKKKERVDSTHSSYSLQIHQTSSPQSQEGDDKFKFNNIKLEPSINKKNVQSSFFDKVFFTFNSIYSLFNFIDLEQQNFVDAQMISKLFKQKNEYIDDSLLKQLLKEDDDPSEELVKLCNFFSQNGQMNFNEFKNIFRFREKKYCPLFEANITQLCSFSKTPTYFIVNEQNLYLLFEKQLLIYVENGPQSVIQSQSIELLSETYARIIPLEQHIVFVINDNSSLLFQLYDKETHQMSEKFIRIFFGIFTLTELVPPNWQLIVQIEILDSKNIILFEESTKLSSISKPTNMPIPIRNNFIYSDGLFMFINSDCLHRIWLTGSINYFSSNLSEILRRFGRQESKIKVRLSSSSLNRNQMDMIGQYQIISQIYPQNERQILQFRIFRVLKQQTERPQILMQRSVYGEFESFDDCYSICTYFDQQQLLQDFFITQEFDGHIRLNMVLQEGESIYKEKESQIWLMLKKSIKTLHHLRLNGIIVQEMNPHAIRYLSDKIIFLTIISKQNFPSIYNDKFVPIVGEKEFSDLISFKASQDNHCQNQILLNPLKANIYHLALVFMKVIHKKPPPFTNDFQLFVSQAINTLQCQNELKKLLNEMLCENENSRLDCTQLLKLIRQREQENYNMIYFPAPQQQQFLKIPTKSISDNNQQQNLVVLSENNLYIFGTQNKLFKSFIVEEDLKINIISLLKIESEECFLTLKVFARLRSDQLTEYKIIVFKLREDQKDELVNFNDFIDDENEENKRNTISLQQYVKWPNLKVNEIEIPFFEIFEIESYNIYNQENDTYFFGRDKEPDCFMYNCRKQVGKKIGSLCDQIDECNVIDTNEQFYLIERKLKIEKNKIYINVQVVQKNQFIVNQRKVKLRSSQNFDGFIDVFKISGNILLIFLQKYEAGWLLNLDVFKTIQLETKSDGIINDLVKPMQISELPEQHPFKIIYHDEKKGRFYQYTLQVYRSTLQLKIDKLLMSI